MKPAGSDYKRLTYNEDTDDKPQWSPDGERIVVNSVDDDGRATFCIISRDASHEIELTVPGAGPSGSRQGENTAFVSGRPSDISITNAVETGERHLTDSDAQDGAPAFSPDGTKMVFLSILDAHYEFYTMKRDGSGVSRLINGTASSSAPSWSTDGRE